MDIALCIIDEARKKMNFAGAYNPLYVLRNKDLPAIDGNVKVNEYEQCYLYHIKPDPMPIGIHLREGLFTDCYIDIFPSDEFFIFSDGFLDQIGGVKNERLKSRRFKDIIASTYLLPMSEKKTIIEQLFVEWMQHEKELGQMDDVLIIGMKV